MDSDGLTRLGSRSCILGSLNALTCSVARQDDEFCALIPGSETGGVLDLNMATIEASVRTMQVTRYAWS